MDTICGRTWRCPVVPEPALKTGTGDTQVGVPGEQKKGAVQLVETAVVHEESVYVTLFPEQE